MKGFCYITLIIGFFIFFQQNPIYAIIIIVLFVGVYIFFKSRSSGSEGGVFGFLSGKQHQHDSKIDDLITLMMIQQLMNPSYQNNDNQPKDERRKDHEEQIDKIKKEILDLLEND